MIPVEVYNPTDDPIQLFKRTTLGIVTPVHQVSDARLETVSSRVTSQVDRFKSANKTTESLPEELESLV